MIIRIGDERRSLIEDHVRKLKDFIMSPETQKYHRNLAIESLISAVANLPHKAFIYGALFALVAKSDVENSLTQDILNAAIE
jgi:hypothetical protein